MKFNTIVNNFTSGVWSPKMIARAETEEYFKSCTELKNMLPMIYGGAFSRPGSLFENVGTFQSRIQDGTRIFPFSISNGSRYLLVVGPYNPLDAATKWFVYDTISRTSTDVTASSDADFSTITASLRVTQVGDVLVIIDNAGIGCPRYLFFLPGTTIPRLVSYANAYVISGLSVAESKAWEKVPYKPVSANGIDGTITVTGTLTAGGAVTLTSSIPRFYSAYIGSSTSGEVGLFIKFSKGTKTGVVEVLGYTNASTVTGLVRSDMSALGASPITFGASSGGATDGTSFELAAWNDYDGWPRTVTSFEQRLYYGGSAQYPDTIWGSRVGDIFTMMEVPFQQDPTFSSFSSDNSRPWSAALAVSSESHAIRAMSAAKTLTIHTLKLDIVAYGGNSNVLGPLNKSFSSSTSFGSTNVQPVRVNNYLTYVQRGGKKVRDLVYSFDEDQYKAQDLSFMADHYFVNDPIEELCSFEMLSSFLLARTENDKLYACSLDRDYKMNAWHQWELGGTQAKVKSFAVSPSGGNQHDEDVLFLVVERNTGSGLIYNLERVSSIYDKETYDFQGNNIISIDSAYDKAVGVPTNVFDVRMPTTLYSHLAGHTVAVFADGFYIGDYPIVAGTITLPKSYSYIVFGVKYTKRFKISPIQAGAKYGTPVNQVKTAARMIINFYKTLACSYKTTGTLTMSEVAFREPGVAGNAVTPLFTGEKVVTLPSYIGRKFEVEIETTEPLPMNVLSLVFEGITND